MNGDQLRRLREFHGLTQREVADRAGLRQSDISAIENGRRDTDELRRKMTRGIALAISPSRTLRLRRGAMSDYLAARDVTDAYVFGSTARGDDGPGSDIDIIAKMPTGTTLFDLSIWEDDLCRLAGGITVDLVPDSARARAKLMDLDRDGVPL